MKDWDNATFGRKIVHKRAKKNVSQLNNFPCRLLCSYRITFFPFFPREQTVQTPNAPCHTVCNLCFWSRLALFQLFPGSLKVWRSLDCFRCGTCCLRFLLKQQLEMIFLEGVLVYPETRKKHWICLYWVTCQEEKFQFYSSYAPPFSGLAWHLYFVSFMNHLAIPDNLYKMQGEYFATFV